MDNILKAILKNSCTITHYAASDGWTAPATSTITAACRFEREDGYVQGATGQMIAYSGRLILSGDTPLLMTDKVTVDAVVYTVLKVSDVRNFSGQIMRIDGYLS